MKFDSMQKGHDNGSDGREASDDEKVMGVKPGEFETLGAGELPHDPDEHLSAEERAKIVRYLHDLHIAYTKNLLTSSSRTVSSSGNSTCA